MDVIFCSGTLTLTAAYEVWIGIDLGGGSSNDDRSVVEVDLQADLGLRRLFLVRDAACQKGKHHECR